jgi:hypothetical protein
MGRAMAWHEISTESATMTRQAEAWVDEVYTDYRNRGWERPVALEQTALDLGITPRRVRSLLQGDATRIAAELWQDMRRRFLQHLENEAEYAMKRAATRAAQLKGIEQASAELRSMRR